MVRFHRRNRHGTGATHRLRRRQVRCRRRPTERRLGAFEILEDRCLLAADFGDAPDTALGTGPGNYQTLANDNGPRHTIVVGLRIGANVDGFDGGVLQNAAANADDVNGALPNDEDGVANPATDLVLTIGAAPRVNVWVTNTTGTDAVLYGWIDYNADGVFDNATERASIAVPAGTDTEIVTLTFPTVPSGYTGTTYARFRLSTDPAAAEPNGPATDGEVEDYLVRIRNRAIGQADSVKSVIITSDTNGGPTLDPGDGFGAAAAALGDLDGDGITDVAIGVRRGSPSNTGAVLILFMNADGTAKYSQMIASGIGGGPTVAGSYFGGSLAALGDLDGDGVPDLAATGDGVHILFLNQDGTVRASQRIASGVGGGPITGNKSRFGSSVASVGDVDGDGVADLAVGDTGDSEAGTYSGAVYVLFMNADGTAKSSQKIASGIGGGPVIEPYENFGRSVEGLGDIDGDGIGDLAVGDFYDAGPGQYRGAVIVLFLNTDGTVKNSQVIGSSIGGGPPLADYDLFATSIASLGDLDGDGVTDIAVGAPRDNSGGANKGALYVLLLNADGTAKSGWKVASNSNGGPDLPVFSYFGSSVGSLGDIDGDGVPDTAVGAVGGGDEYGNGDYFGTVHVLFLRPFTPDFGDAPDTGPGTGPGNYQTRADDNGPSHVIVDSLRLGASVDSDDGTLANVAANADTFNGVLTGGEGGLVNSVADLQLTVGAQPTIRMWATNLTGGDADLFGWIDYNADGLFDNATERASIAVPNGTDTEIVTLTFPAVPAGFTGTTYARFRLSTDAAAADPTGPAADGEVEDYRVQITAPSRGTVQSTKTSRIADNPIGGAVASLGDLDGDGVTDIVVGSRGADSGRGALYVLFMNAAGTVKQSQKIGHFTGGLLGLAVGQQFGSAVAALGDLDGDGVTDIAVGTDGRGVFVLHLNASGTVKRSQLIIGSGTGVGSSLAGVGDLNGDGIGDLAAEGPESSSGGVGRGAVYLLLLNSDGSIKAGQIIGSDIGGGPTLEDEDLFGSSVTTLGDLDGDGFTDIAVGAVGVDTGGNQSGAVYVLFLNADGTAKSSQKIASGMGGGPILTAGDHFGASLSALGDLDGDGVTELAVGARYDDTGGSARGAMHILFLNADGTAKRVEKIAHGTGGGPPLPNFAIFGESVASLGDLDGDGITDLAVGASGGSDGAVYVLFLQPERLAGDYNGDNVVDTADYTKWRDTLGQTGLEPYSGADGDGDGEITQADRQVWVDHFGQFLTPVVEADGGGAISTAIVESSQPPLPTAQIEPPAPVTRTGIDSVALAEPMATAPNTEMGADSAPMAQPVARPVKPRAIPAGFVPPTVFARRDGPHFTRHAPLPLAVSHDNALVAWLASSRQQPRRETAGADGDDSRGEPDRRDSPGQFADALELAFATLGV